MKVTFISDTHGKHRNLYLPGGDILIHAGDIEARNKHGLVSFCEWFEKQEYKHKIFIAGNHDFYLQRPDSMGVVENYDMVYLEDSYVDVCDVRIWGSPWSLPFFDWAFMKNDGDLDYIYKNIPLNSDIVINHGAPYGILDTTTSGKKTGSNSLIRNILRVTPKICVFGHIHESYGKKNIGGTLFINASVMDENYNMVNSPISLNI